MEISMAKLITLIKALGGGDTGGVSDVQVNGTSVVSGDVANITTADLDAVVAVTGTTPSIPAVAGTRYVCGECATLTVNVPASGIIDVVFESGSTPTLLTIAGATVTWANGFDPTALAANTTYELNIMDGLGVAVSWT